MSSEGTYRKERQSQHGTPPLTKTLHPGRNQASDQPCTTKCFNHILSLGKQLNVAVVCKNSHGLAGQRVDNALRIKVLLSVGVLSEELARTVTEQLVVCYLELERTRVPFVVEVDVIGVNEGELLI